MATDAVAGEADRIKKFLDDLEAEKNLITNCTLLWKSLADSYSSLDRALADRSQALDGNIQTLNDEARKTLESLDAREASIADREASAAALIEERKDSILTEIEGSGKSEAPEDVKGILRWYARRMDSAGLWRFMVSRRKDLATIRKEIAEAVAESVDPARLVVDAADDYMTNKADDGPDRSWALGMLVRSLFDAEGRKAPEVTESMKERAAAVATAWKEKFNGEKEGGEKVGEGKMGASEAQILIQMIVAFGLSSRFDDEFLKKLVLENSSRKEISKLAAGLGLGEKLADVIDELIKSGKEIEAVYFACESGLTERFPPVPLLKSCLQASKRKANSIPKAGKSFATALEESNALKSIIKCIEACNLESNFNIEGLKKQLAEIEKTKAEKKRSAVSNKSHGKRTRSTGGSAPTSRHAKASRTPNVAYASYSRNQHTLPHLPASRNAYNFPSHGGLDGPSSASYGATYNQSPTVGSQQYYVLEDSVVGRQSSVPYSGHSASYSGYDYNAAAPTQQLYPR